MAALAILGVAASLVGPAIEVVKWVSAPVRRQFNYLCCFRSNIDGLKDEANNLDDKTRDIEIKVSEANNNAQVISSQVEAWLRNSDETKTETKGILDKAPNVESGCLNLGKRYSRSKEAKKATIAIKELVEKCKFEGISHKPSIAAIAPVQSSTKVYEFQSRRQIEEGIMKNLGDKNVSKIGICGMGGLGKTTMAQMIMNRALQEGFDEVVKADVSQTVDKLNIQLQIADPLGVKFEGDTLISRANVLHKRLKGNTRSLIVLDDVWESLDMEELGIPCGDGCKVILTSRDAGVLRAMDVENVCQLEILDDKEAWILFRGKVGTCVDNVVLNPIAKAVMRECKGLPMALLIVGEALKGENLVSSWEDALRQFRKSNPLDIPIVIEKVYNHLKWSYDRLGSQNAKSVFLLCCLFPEDCDIPLKQLAYFAMGLHLFQDIGELKEVRGRTSALIRMLKNRCLLLDGSDEDHVRMHDVLRDVAIYIASTEGQVKCNDCTWISSNVDGGPRPQSSFPKLKLLLMNNKAKEQEMEINIGNLTGGSTELNVLFIEEYGLLKSVRELCTSVVTLVLYKCSSLKSVAAVGQLKSLEILIFSSCNSIEEFQVRGLKRLKLLQVSKCPILNRIPAGLISSLVELEELKIVGCFNNWNNQWEIEEGNEASLRELESLKKLRRLDIEVSDIALAAQPINLSSELLVQFRVRFGEYIQGYNLPKRSYQRKMSLNYGYGSPYNGEDMSTNMLLTHTECLFAAGTYYEIFKLNLATAKSIRWLALEKFKNENNVTSIAATFPLLESLSLENMDKLEEIWDDAPIPSNSFTNLKHLNLVDLGLKRMGVDVLSTAKGFFLQLETIHIDSCHEMEHLLVFVPNEEEHVKEDDVTLLFPKLERIHLGYLPKLRIIMNRGIESIQFPLLADMKILGCENLQWLPSRDDDHHHHYQDSDSLHLFCHPKVSFPNLERLTIGRMESKNIWCDKVPIAFFTGLVELYIDHNFKIRRLFSSSSNIHQNLVNLQKLEIDECEEMVKVFEDEDVSSCDHTTILPIFPSLRHIKLKDLRKLESFCQWRCALELPSLNKLDIYFCGGMKSFNAGAGSLITPALQTIYLNAEVVESVDHLNAKLHEKFEISKKWNEEYEKRKELEKRKQDQDEEEEDSWP